MKIGRLTVNWGSMYSGKTEELIRQMNRASYAKKPYLLFKPKTDNRYSKKDVVAHTGDKLAAVVVEHPLDILNYVEKNKSRIQVVGIDEGQFFDESLLDIIRVLKYKGIDVYISGLDMKYNGKPFPTMMKLAAVANEAKKIHAVCVSCGSEEGYVSHRTIKEKEDIVVGSEGIYVALCESCFINEKNKKRGVKEWT